MTIAGNDISTYGLRLLEAKGFNNLPKRKKILKEPGFEAKDIQHENYQVSVQLFGKYTDRATLATNIDNLKAQLEFGYQQFGFPSHGETLGGQCISGVSVKVIKNVAVVKFEITV